jgi:hypothetical protein
MLLCTQHGVFCQMSIIGWILGLSPSQIAALQATPAAVRDLVEVTQADASAADLAEALSRMTPEQRKAAEARNLALDQMPGQEEARSHLAAARKRLGRSGTLRQALCIEKSWHILHYLFTGHVDPSEAPGNALLTGEPLGDDLGYGPARLHGAKETRDFADFLAAQNVMRLQQRVNYHEMSSIPLYGMPASSRADADTVAEYESALREEVAYFFPRLRDYVSAMAERQNGLLLWFS